MQDTISRHLKKVLAGRTALISGGGRGIGRAIACGLAADGASVAITYFADKQSADSAANVIVARGGLARTYRLAAHEWSDVAEVVGAVSNELGPIDILINNAGVRSQGKSVVDADTEVSKQTLLLNAMSAFFLSKAVLPRMRKCERGDIIMVSSRATVELAANRAAYAMSKSAMETLAASLAIEERAHGVRVNAIAPGFVDTELGRTVLNKRYGVCDPDGLASRAPFGRFCSVDDVAELVRFLVSPAGGYITGQRIGLDGGGTSALFREIGRPSREEGSLSS